MKVGLQVALALLAGFIATDLQTQAFKAAVEPGFPISAEDRRHFSDRNHFVTATQGVLNAAQGTATPGLVYGWGTKQGAW